MPPVKLETAGKSHLFCVYIFLTAVTLRRYKKKGAVFTWWWFWSAGIAQMGHFESHVPHARYAFRLLTQLKHKGCYRSYSICIQCYFGAERDDAQ